MRELPLRDPYSCRTVCYVVITLKGLTAAIGPAGDTVYIPMRITGGQIIGLGAQKTILSGSDFAAMYADEQFVHNGNFAAADPAGDIIFWYDGVSQAGEGAYDQVLDGQLPGKIPCRLSIRSISTNPDWKQLNRRPLLGVGSFDGTAGRLEFTLFSITENGALS